MTRFTKDSKFRLRDFEKRRSWNSENCEIYGHQGLSQSYIPLYPFGNEVDLLEKLAISKESCIWVDAYWNMDNDVSFLQVLSKEASSNAEVGLFAQWGNTIKEYLTLTAVVDQPYITRAIFEEQMELFSSLDIDPSEQLRRKLKDSKVRL